MAMGRSGAVQDDLMATWAERPRSPGHAFYDRLQEVLREADFDGFVEEACKPEDGRAVAAARPLFSHAHDRLFRGDRQRTRPGLALLGFLFAA